MWSRTFRIRYTYRHCGTQLQEHVQTRIVGVDTTNDISCVLRLICSFALMHFTFDQRVQIAVHSKWGRSFAWELFMVKGLRVKDIFHTSGCSHARCWYLSQTQHVLVVVLLISSFLKCLSSTRKSLFYGTYRIFIIQVQQGFGIVGTRGLW